MSHGRKQKQDGTHVTWQKVKQEDVMLHGKEQNRKACMLHGEKLYLRTYTSLYMAKRREPTS